MTTHYLNLVRHTVAAAPGQNSFQLGPVVTGFLTMQGAGAVNSRTYAYGAESDFVNGVATRREVGLGVWNATSEVLTRETVKNSTAGGTTKETFGDDCEVVILPLADDLDMRLLASENLGDVSNKPAAFDNIKQAATTGYVGAVELATRAEAEAQVDAARAVTPSALANYALLSEVPGAQDATTTQKGVVELATLAEAEAQADGTRAVTPASLAGYALVAEIQNLVLGQATTTQAGIVELATQAEAEAQVDTTRAVTPADLANYALLSEIAAAQVPPATTTVAGIVELATQAEAQAQSDSTRAVTPLGLANYALLSEVPAQVPAASTSVAGIAELATQAEAETRTDVSRTVTPFALANFALKSEAITPLEASTTQQGLVELATQAEAEAQTDTQRAVTPVSLVNYALLSEIPANVPIASDTVQGKVELATQIEAEARTDTARAVTPGALVNFALQSEVGSGAFFATGGTFARNQADREADIINVKEFGALGNDSADDTAAIQAAIDYAVTNHKSKVFIPAGRYRTTLPLFLDAPNNMRGNAAAWAAGTTYAVDAVVKHLGVPWKSLANGNIGNTPSMASTFWKVDCQSANTFGFSLHLEGDHGASPPPDNYGAIILPQFNNGVCLYMGPGQGCQVSNLNLLGPETVNYQNYRGTQHPDSHGIAVAAMNAGTTRNCIDSCHVQNFYRLISVGVITPTSGLGDSNRISRCHLTNGYVGIEFGSTQALDNDLYSNVIGYTTICVLSAVGAGCNIFGGNYSPISQHGGKCSITGATNFAGGTYQDVNYSFDAEITAPAWDDQKAYHYRYASPNIVSHNGTVWYLMSELPAGVEPQITQEWWGRWWPLEELLGTVFNRHVILTEHFGALPFTITNYNPTTHVATFTLAIHPGGEDNIRTVSAINADMQAGPALYLAELPSCFVGSQIKAHGVLIEQSLPGPLMVMDGRSGWAGGGPSVLQGARFNSDIAITCEMGYWPSYYNNYAATQDWNQTQYLVARCWPAFIGGQTGIAIRECACQGTSVDEGIMVTGSDIRIEGNTYARFVFSDGSTAINTAVDVWQEPPSAIKENSHCCDALLLMKKPCSALTGWRPAPWTTPWIGREYWRALNLDPIPQITSTATEYPVTYNLTSPEPYPLLWGGRTYAISQGSYYNGQWYGYEDHLSTLNPPHPLTIKSFMGRNGAGAISMYTDPATFCVGDAVQWVWDVTNGEDATAKFEHMVTVVNQLQQVSAEDLSAVKFQIGWKSPDFCMSRHVGYTWGQDLTDAFVPNIGWSYSGRSWTVYCNPELMELLFPGLHVSFTGIENDLYEIRQTHKWLGYFTVGDNIIDGHGLLGTSGQIYTGTTVYQQPFNMSGW